MFHIIEGEVFSSPVLQPFVADLIAAVPAEPDVFPQSLEVMIAVVITYTVPIIRTAN